MRKFKDVPIGEEFVLEDGCAIHKKLNDQEALILADGLNYTINFPPETLVEDRVRQGKS